MYIFFYSKRKVYAITTTKAYIRHYQSEKTKKQNQKSKSCSAPLLDPVLRS